MMNQTDAASAQAQGTAPVVSVRDVSRVYGSGNTAVHALNGVNLEVGSRMLVAVTGRSGSGKTTLLNLIGGLDNPTSGRIYVQGRDITDLSEDERTHLRRHTLGFIFQSFALLPTLSALENVALALHIAGVGPRERDRRAREVLELVGLGGRLDHRPYELSGGEQERVAVARALANQPALILADEPTGELDTATGQEILGLLAEVVKTADVAMIVATHDTAVTAAADAVYRLVDGSLQEVA
ncbi:MAG TPA: ABC transporter ATP-binding protein [Chloroflexota bacterium]|nr:ABC transporter ATP-binding protein [Chloroflexota bacterium]